MMSFWPTRWCSPASAAPAKALSKQDAGTLTVDLTVQQQNFSLQLHEQIPLQGVTALFGRSGCGKTTLLRAIAGLDRHPTARIHFAEQPWQTADTFMPVHQRRIGMVFQESSLLPHLNVQQNLLFGYQRRASRLRVQLQPADVIDLLELAPLLTQAPGQLSGGQRQRVALGRALLSQPQLLLLDEPLASLDQQSRQEILPFLQKVARELNIPMLLVSHQLEDVVKLADHLLLLQDGRVISRGPLAQQLLQPEFAACGAMSVLTAVYQSCQHFMLQLTVGGQLLQVPAPVSSPTANGSYRLRILARDVALSLKPLAGSSVTNQLAVTIIAIQAAAHPAEVLVQLEVADQPLQALLTRQSAQRLALTPGQALFAQIKAVALD